MMMFSKAFKKMRETWESDMRVGVVEQESLEEDKIEDLSGFCVPVTNKLVPTVKIIPKDIPASDLGISRMEQLVENKGVEGEREKETYMGTCGAGHRDETLVCSRLEPFIPAGKEYYIARAGVEEKLNCSGEQVKEEMEPDIIRLEEHTAVAEDANLLGEVVEQGDQDDSSSTLTLSTGNQTKDYSNCLSNPAAEFEMNQFEEEVGDVEQGLIALQDAPVLGSVAVQAWILNERTEIKQRGVTVAKYQGYLEHALLSYSSLEVEEEAIGMARDNANCNIAKRDIKPIIIADQSEHFKKSDKTRNRSWCWWWVLTLMVFLSNMTTKLVSYQDPGFGVQPGSVDVKSDGLSGMGFFMDLEGEMENNTLVVYESWVERLDGHSHEELFRNHFILGEGEMMGIWNKTRSPNLKLLGMEMYELTATADEANSLVTTGVETGPIINEGFYLGNMEEEVTHGITGLEMLPGSNTWVDETAENYMELPGEHVFLGGEIENWNKTRFLDREVMDSLEESLAFSEVNATMVDSPDHYQDNHIGLAEVKTYEAVITGSGAAGNPFSQTGGGEEEMFEGTVMEAVADIFRAAIRLVTRCEADFTESGAADNPFSQTGGGEEVKFEVTDTEAVVDMIRAALRVVNKYEVVFTGSGAAVIPFSQTGGGEEEMFKYQDNHIGLVEERTFKAAFSKSGAAGNTFGPTGGGEEETFKVTVTEAVAEVIKAALRVVARYEAVFTESGAVGNPFSQTGGGEGVIKEMTVKKAVADMTREVLRDMTQHEASSQDQKHVFFQALFLATALGCPLFQFWHGGDDPHELLVDGGQVYSRGGISYTNRKEVEKFKGTKEGEMKSAKASSECLANKSPEIDHPAADADVAAMGSTAKPEDKQQADILYAAEVLRNLEISHMHAAHEIGAKQAVSLSNEQGKLKCTVLGEPHDGLVSHAEQTWDYLPYNNVSWLKVEYDEVRADHIAARECLNLACKLAYKELKHNNNIEVERKQIMVQELGLLMDNYVSTYSDHESLSIRQRGQSFPVQIETRLWEMNEAVEEVKDIIRDHTSSTRTPPTSPCRTSGCSSVPGMLRLNRRWPGLCMTSPGTGRRSSLSPSFVPWSSSRG